MAGKSKKKRNGKDNGNGNDEKRRGSNQQDGKAKKSTSGRAKSAKLQGDIFTEGAMENAYYLCHNVQDVLKTRGFAWPDARKKKGKK